MVQSTSVSSECILMVELSPGVTGVFMSYPWLATPAGCRCTGPQTSAPAAALPPETPLKRQQDR